MVVRKIICLLCAACFVQCVIAQENTYDNAIGEAISRSDWFETRALFRDTADSLSDYMRLFSGALLDHNFNKPAGAVEKIQRMYDKYGAQMGGNVFSLFWMMSDNLTKLGHYKAAHDICTSLLAQGRDYMDQGTRAAYQTGVVLFGQQSLWPRMRVSDAEVNYEIPFDIEDEQIKFAAVRGKQRISVMLDSGGQMTIIERDLAHKLELPISADSVQLNDARCPLALLDTLRLGVAEFVNIPCAVLPLREVGVTDCDMIFGNDILQLFSEIELDYEQRILYLRSQTEPMPNAPRNLMLNKIPYIRAKLNGIPITLLWDTGSNKSSVMPHFYNAHRDYLPSIQKHGSKRAKTSTGKTQKLNYAILPQLKLTIADTTGEMTNVYMIEDMPHVELMGVPFDAILGALPPAEYKRLIINFSQMYFVVE